MVTRTDRPRRGLARGKPSDEFGEGPQRPSGPAASRPARPTALAALLAVAAVAVAIALGLTAGPAPPATGAASLVPADALLYVHVSTDGSRPSVRQALARARRVSAASRLFADATDRLDAMLTGSGAPEVSFATDVRPWLGREAALAVLDTPGTTAGTLIVLDVRDRARARAFLASSGAVPAGPYRGVPLLRQASGTSLAFVGHYLVLGQPPSVTAAIDVAQRPVRALAQSAVYQRAAGAEPADRVVDLYAPAAGINRALLPRQGFLGALGVLLYQPALRAVTASLSPSAGGAEILVHSVLDPKLAAPHEPQFSPSLPDVLPAGSTLVLDAANLRGAAPKLLAAAARLGVAGRVVQFLSRLGSALVAQGVSLRQLFSIFGGESAFALVPGRGGGGPAPVMVGRTGHPAAARRELADLEYPLTQAFAPPATGGGVVPVVGGTTVAGTMVSELHLAPGFEVDWAVSHGLVVLSTSLRGVTAVIGNGTRLSTERAYRVTLGGHPGQMTSLVFFDLPRLLRLGEQTGLIGGTELAALRPDLDQIRAIGVSSTRGEADTTTKIQLQIR